MLVSERGVGGGGFGGRVMGRMIWGVRILLGARVGVVSLRVWRLAW